MDACHILLGRPWQYESSVVHDGRKNTYSFSSKGNKIVLAPHREGINLAPIVDNNNLLSMSRFLVEVEREDRVYALLPYGNSAVDETPNLPLEVQQLLAEFSET
jgi:alpha-D-ribose 1-methylphosphonate 5-phosphate C-P lyase